MSFWGQFITIAARYLSMPLAEYFKNVTRINMHEKTTTSRSRLFFKYVGERSRYFQKVFERYIFKKDKYKIKYGEKDEERILIERGIKYTFDSAFYFFIFTMGYLILYKQDVQSKMHSKTYNYNLSETYNRLRECNVLLEELHELHLRNIEAASEQVKGVEKVADDIDIYLLCSTTYAYRLSVAQKQFHENCDQLLDEM